MAAGEPLLILAPHRSYTSVVCAMIGRHPQMYGLPEMNLFQCETMMEWWLMFGRGSAIGAHGPLRVVAELFFGGQDETTIQGAWQWLRQRLRCDTGYVFREIARRVHPRGLVDKSPMTAYKVEHMQRAWRVFPDARFLHLLRHPAGHGASVIKSFAEFEKYGALGRGMKELLAEPSRARTGAAAQAGQREDGLFDCDTDPPVLDPQMRWHRLHSNICEFLATVPRDRWLRLKGEDLLSDPDRSLGELAGWLGLRTDSEALAEMKHPELSPYACFGPSNAHLGNDPNFLQQPALAPGRVRPQTLDGPVPWRQDGTGFKEPVKQLARQFGYA